jgi:NADH dehydrogenase
VGRILQGGVALDVVTGAFSFTGRAIAAELLARGRSVRTLSRSPAAADDALGGRVEWRPLQFRDVDVLRESLEGAETLYNTYWVRFERSGSTFSQAVENIRTLVGAARDASLRRIVHVSVANPSESSPFPYFRGKARAERCVEESGLSYAIVRPTLLFGRDDILVNNIAWTVRRSPVFMVAGREASAVQPVSVDDVATLCADAGAVTANETLDAAGPETYAFPDLVRAIGAAVGRAPRVIRVPAGIMLAVSAVVGAVTRDVVVTREELAALSAGLLASGEEPRGHASFRTWLDANGDGLGRRYMSELGRNFRPHAPL